MNNSTETISLLRKTGSVLIPLAIILAGGAAWGFFKATAPVIEKTEAHKTLTQVQTIIAQNGSVTTQITAMGTVVASREVTVKTRVSGEINRVSGSFVPGGLLKKNEVLLALDDTDHEIAVLKAQSTLDDVQAELEIEKGSQAVAREELRLLADISNEKEEQTDLSLRKPQLKQAQAAVASAAADLKQANLDLARTVIRAPFNSIVLERSVDFGTYVNEQDTLATLAATDRFWVEAVVPVDRLAMIDLDRDGGCPAVIRSQAGTGNWQAEIVRIAGALNENSRMATVILAIDDPLGIKEKSSGSPLLINDYVYADIAGRTLENVVELPRTALQERDTVWICEKNRLSVRTVETIWKTESSIYVKNGVAVGERVVISGISNPVDGMELVVADNTSVGTGGLNENR